MKHAKDRTLLTCGQVAEMLGCSRDKINYMVDKGELTPHSYIGARRHKRFSREQIDQYIASTAVDRMIRKAIRELKRVLREVG